MLAVVIALALGADSNDVKAGLFGFSPVLTAIAVGTVFHAPQLRVVVYAAAATIFTVIVQAALNVVFLPIGIPTLGDFRRETGPLPAPSDGQLPLRTQYLSLDPYMCGWMNDAQSYAAPVELGQVMEGDVIEKIEILP